MSATTGKPSPPTLAIISSVWLGSMSGNWLTPTSAPSAARRTAVAWPIPLVAPVTSATLPSKRRNVYLLKDRDRVPWRPGAAWQPQRQPDDHELEAALLGARLGQVLQLEAVRGKHAHRGHLERVDRVEHALHIAGHGLPVAVRQERRDPPLVHPRDRVDVQA